MLRQRQRCILARIWMAGKTIADDYHILNPDGYQLPHAFHSRRRVDWFRDGRARAAGLGEFSEQLYRETRFKQNGSGGTRLNDMAIQSGHRDFFEYISCRGRPSARTDLEVQVLRDCLRWRICVLLPAW